MSLVPAERIVRKMMSRSISRLAQVRLGTAIVLAVAVTIVIGVGLAGAQVPAALTIPHTLAAREQCTACHNQGSANPMPGDHTGRTDAACSSCHKPGDPQPATGAPPATKANTTRSDVPSDSACMACHAAKVAITFASGQTDSASIDIAALQSSVHKSISCTACHPDKSAGYPHAKVASADARAYTVDSASRCQSCHADAASKMASSVHGQARESGNTKAATCTDCHGIHDVTKAARLERRPQLCGSCHTVVTATYQESVHGQLLASGRADAASCLDCHTRDKSGHSISSVSNPEGPTSDRNVPDTCGKCHYQALKTYNTTFHGRAMRLGVSGNAPNCVDCHGAYGVQRVHASEAPVDETIFASACAKCHQGAGENFASGWMGHEEASPTWFPAVFFTERFLFFLTTSVVAFGILHVEFDLLRWLVSRRRERGDGGKEEK